MRVKHTLSNNDHPKGSRPGEWNAWDVILWLLGGWIWAGFRWYGRHHDWTRTKQNVWGIGTGVALWFVLVVIAVATGPVEDTQTGQSSNQSLAQNTSEPAEEATPEPTPRVRETTDADGKFTSSCEEMLPDDIMSDAYRFVASAKMRNTGNVGIVVKVKARFDQVASANVTDEKTVNIPVGKSRTAKFSIPATSGQVDEYQASPDYFGDGDSCKVHVTITDTFGRPPFED